MRWTVQCGPYHTNTQCARLTEFIGGNGLDVGIFIRVHQSIGFNHKGVCVQDSMIALQKLKSTRIQGRRPWAMCSTTGMNSSTSASLGSQTWPVTPSQLWLWAVALSACFPVQGLYHQIRYNTKKSFTTSFESWLSTFRKETQNKCKERTWSVASCSWWILAWWIFLWKFNEIQLYSEGGGVFILTVYILSILSIFIICG